MDTIPACKPYYRRGRGTSSSRWSSGMDEAFQSHTKFPMVITTKHTGSCMYCQPSAGTGQWSRGTSMQYWVYTNIYRSDHTAIPSTPTTSHMQCHMTVKFKNCGNHVIQWQYDIVQIVQLLDAVHCANSAIIGCSTVAVVDSVYLDLQCVCMCIQQPSISYYGYTTDCHGSQALLKTEYY